VKETADANIGCDGAEAANDGALANVGGSHHDRLPTDDGDGLETLAKEAFARSHAGMRVGKSDVKEGRRTRRGKKRLSAQHTYTVHLFDSRHILDEYDIGRIVVTLANNLLQDWHDRPTGSARAEQTIQMPFSHVVFHPRKFVRLRVSSDCQRLF
jgi:hypothetical protein